jgi:hypothetical protein
MGNTYTYQMQYPNMNLGVYSPRSVSARLLPKVEDLQVDTSSLVGYVPNSTSLVANAVWLSSFINAGNKEHTSEETFVKSCKLRYANHTIYDTVNVLNEKSNERQYLLSRVGSWEDMQLALMEGFTVMLGGTVYSSFSQAETSGIVPMPRPGEGLLGGQIINLISFDREKDLGWAIGNQGKDVGQEGLFQYRGSHMRNLGIFRDFFLLTLER